MPEATLVTCCGCGLTCDDVAVDLSAPTPRVDPPCPLAIAWFAGRDDRPAASVAGRAAPYAAAVRRAAELLASSRRPLILGFENATVEAAREALALADALGAAIDLDAARHDGEGGRAVTLRGASTATLGEIRDRSGLVVVWREDPLATHPRLLERLRLPAPGRTLVVVDDRATATAAAADVHLRVAPGDDLRLIRTLHLLVRPPVGAASSGAGADGGVGLGGEAEPATDAGRAAAALHELVARVPHVAFVHGGGLSPGEGGWRRALALHELVRAISDERHVVTLALRRFAGSAGAEEALAWQTGFPGSVDLGSGHPEMLRSGRARLEAGEVDVLLSVESDPGEVPPDTRVVAVGCSPVAGADVELRTAAPGIGARGTVHRTDGVPLALDVPAPSALPSAAAALADLRAELGP